MAKLTPIHQGEEAIKCAKVNDIIILSAINYFDKDKHVVKLESIILSKETIADTNSYILDLPSYKVSLINGECKIYSKSNNTWMLPTKMEKILLVRPSQLQK